MPGISAGDAYLDVHPALAAGFARRLSSQVQGPMGRAGDEASRQFGRRFTAGLKTAGIAIGTTMAAATVLAARGISATTKAASDLNETINQVNVIFGRSAPTIQKWARGSAKALGLSRNEALTNATAFGDMFRQLGIGLPTTTKMSTKLVGLASDLASFKNADITQVLEAQQAAFRGEYDSLQRFIPNINAARVQEVALAQTHKKSAKDLTAAEKAQATYTIMLRDSVRAQGDFQRTSTGLANQQRIQKAQWENLKTVIGQGFLPAQLAVTKVITSKLLPAATALAREFGPRIGAAVSAAANALARSVPPADQLAGSAQRLGERLPGLGEATRTLVDRFKGLGPQLRSTNLEASSLPPVLDLAGAGFKFLSDHSGFLARHIGLVVGALLAYKAIQTAAQAADTARVALLPLQIAGNIALARSNKTLALAMAQQRGATVASTAATNAGVLASLRQRAAAIASAVAQRVVAIATKAWAVAQRVLNLVLSLNPIGLVITAIAALAAGLIYAYKHSETFRKIVQTAFAGVKVVVGAVVTFIIANFRGWFNIATTVVGGIIHLFGKLPGPLGAPFRKAEEAVRKAKQTVNEQLDRIQARVNRLQGKDIPITARAAVRINESTKLYLRAANVPGFRAKGGLTRLGETAIVGEEGPELVRFHQPAHVYTAAETRSILRRGMAAGGAVGDAGDVRGARVGSFGSISDRDLRDRIYNPVVAATSRLGQRVADFMARAIGSGLTRAIGAIGGARIGRVLRFAMAQLGEPYQWGATGPDRWDCSGLMLRAFAAGGVRLPRVARDQARTGAGVSRAAARLGDLIYFGSPAHHIGLYLGGNRMLHAPHTGDVVRISGGRVGTGYRRVLDRGGWLMPGESGINLTGRPERVLSPGESAGSVYLHEGAIQVFASEGMSERRVAELVVDVLDERARRARKGPRA